MSSLCMVEHGSKSFGGVHALHDMDLSIDKCELVGIIGPNGSGKTTLFNCMSGFLRLSSGRVMWDGRDITRWSMDRIARAGLIRTFQQSMCFPSATIGENIEWACEIARGGRRHRTTPQEPLDLLGRAGLEGIRDVPAMNLSHGTLRLLGIVMALARNPRMLLLDEPAAGLNEAESDELAHLIQSVRHDGTSIVVVDHDMSFMMSLVDRLVVMANGQKLFEGAPQDVQRNQAVIEVYLGAGHSVPDAGASDARVPGAAS